MLLSSFLHQTSFLFLLRPRKIPGSFNIAHASCTPFEFIPCIWSPDLLGAPPATHWLCCSSAAAAVRAASRTHSGLLFVCTPGGSLCSKQSPLWWVPRAPCWRLLSSRCVDFTVTVNVIRTQTGLHQKNQFYFTNKVFRGEGRQMHYWGGKGS